MKRLFFLCLALLLAAAGFQYQAAAEHHAELNTEKTLSTVAAGGSVPGVMIDREFGRVPLYFIANKGQVDTTARFYARTPRFTLWLTTNGLVFDCIQQVQDPASPTDNTDRAAGARPLPHPPAKITRDVSSLVFPGANKNPEIAAIDSDGFRVNYYYGKDPSAWRKGIPTSRAVLYKEMYKHIDLKVYGSEGRIEYDWIVKPGGSPGDIRIHYNHVNGSRLDTRGNLVIETGFGDLVHKKPVGFQYIDTGHGVERVEVPVRFRKTGGAAYRFEVGDYRREYDLVIDPVVVLDYSTFLGGNNFDSGRSIAVDSDGHMCVAGTTRSTDFPTQSPYQGSYSEHMEDAFITKFNLDGSGLIFSTYLGGNGFEETARLAVANDDRLYVVINTESSDLPATGSYYKGNGDLFAVVFDDEGSLLYSRYLGGNKNDAIGGLAVDSAGNAYIAGYTYSTDFPTLNAYQDTFGGDWDAFVTILKPEGLEMSYSTYLGGAEADWALGIAVDSAKAFYVTGFTYGSDFPTVNAYQDAHAGDNTDMFVCKFKADGSSLVYSTYLGGSGDDWGYGIAVDGAKNAYLIGTTDSTDFPTQNAFQDTYGGGMNDVVVARFNSSGSDLLYSTYLGGEDVDSNYMMGIAVDSQGNAYVTGVTGSKDFPLKYAYQNSFGGGSLDAYVAKIKPTGSDLVFSTYLGGGSVEYLSAIALDKTGNVYITGQTGSANFPLKNPFQDAFTYSEAFVSKLYLSLDLTVQSSPHPGATVTVSPADLNGKGDGQTSFTRSYARGTEVMLTAALSYQNQVFYKWVIDGADNFSRTVQVTMNGNHTAQAVYRDGAVISINRDQLVFGAVVNGTNTQAQYLSIDNGGGIPLHWTITDDASWLSCSPTSGTNAGEVAVSVNISGLSAGTYQGTITVTSPDALNSPQTVAVTLSVYNFHASASPFGFFETPQEGSQVYSSIPVTGWVLDDIEVVSVKLYRQEGSGLVYIGDAVFVDGARPDVEQTYPNYPNAYKAGWGYMMLTNFLPGGGNGPFTLHAIATDKEGNRVSLGTKTITCDNAHAIKPFGAIDTPGQGGDASGDKFRNQGWVLTPKPNKVPEDGHTIRVWIDGVNTGQPVYNIYRADIATLFPGYANSGGAMAYFDFDTTPYSNGIHIIQWTAADSEGNTDGIGSRYFNVKNTGGSRTASESTNPAGEEGEPGRFAGLTGIHRAATFSSLQQIPTDISSPIRLKKGFVPETGARALFPDANGNILADTRELELVEIHLGKTGELSSRENRAVGSEEPCVYWQGYRVFGDQLRPLPVGSSLDSREGIFRWLPGPGFLGEFRLVFMAVREDGVLSKRNITIRIAPKFSASKEQ